MERIYDTLKGETLQHWLKVAIIREEEGSARVEFRSTIHVNKVSPVTFSWGAEFSDREILNDRDLLKSAYQKFGREIFTGKYDRDFN